MIYLQHKGFYENSIRGPPKVLTYTPLPPLEYHVMTKDGSDCLGSVNWYGRWRCYSFNPWPQTVFKKTCLREIADFCERLTREHRKDKS